MTATVDLTTDWQRWHDEREATLREPHGWLALTALEWLEETPRTIDGLPGTWSAPGDGTVEITAGATATARIRMRPLQPSDAPIAFTLAGGPAPRPALPGAVRPAAVRRPLVA